MSNAGSQPPGAIEAYRASWNVTTADALGPRPIDPEQCAHWFRAVSVLTAAGVALPPSPRSGPNGAWLSSLWDRVDALDTSRLDRAAEPIALSDHLSGWGRDLDAGYGLDERPGL